MTTSSPPPEHDGTREARLLFRNTMRITDGHLDQYRAAIGRAVAFAEQNAPQIMVDVFIDTDDMRAYSFQLYTDSAAVRRHWQLSDPYIHDVMAHCTVEHFEVYGHPDPDVQAELAASGMDIEFVPRLIGYLHGQP